MTTPTSPTAELLTIAIAYSDKTQAEIAKEAGFDRPNIISMFKTGQTKIPIDRIPELALACGVDPAIMLRVAITEYHPKMWAFIQVAAGQVLTEDERLVLRAYRSGTEGNWLNLTDEFEASLAGMFAGVLKRYEAEVRKDPAR